MARRPFGQETSATTVRMSDGLEEDCFVSRRLASLRPTMSTGRDRSTKRFASAAPTPLPPPVIMEIPDMFVLFMCECLYVCVFYDRLMINRCCK
mmetsp:Transcript_1720/g.2468  ORF Transcript_1720/g.2468 Transcript_1720/m.2468 type:complete len:94 (+) Transcript_1720:858-1139(+)